MWLARGGYLWVRKSKICKFIPHFGWSKGVTDAEHWQPDKPMHGWKVLLIKWCAKGEVKPGD